MFILLLLIIVFLSCMIHKLFYNLDAYAPHCDMNLGNFFSKYFGSMGFSFLNQKDFVYELPIDLVFIKDLPSYLPCDMSIMKQLKAIKLQRKHMCMGRPSFWVVHNRHAEQFWDVMKPTIHSMLNDTFIKNNLKIKVKHPVIHFRCSDVPFIKNPHYHLVKYSFYKDALEESFKKCKKRYKKIIVLSCHDHRSDERSKKACSMYLQSLLEYLGSLGYITHLQCKSNLFDFATLFYAPIVISAGSSFSFMSAYFGNGVFISEGHFTDKPNKKDVKLCLDCGDWLKRGYSIFHEDVVDYYDTELVISKLK